MRDKKIFWHECIKISIFFIIILHRNFLNLYISNISIVFKYDSRRYCFIFIMEHNKIYIHIVFHDFLYVPYILYLFLREIFYSLLALVFPGYFFMSQDYLYGGVEGRIAAHDGVVCISSISFDSHDLEIHNKYFIPFFPFYFIIDKCLVRHYQESTHFLENDNSRWE